jgi:GntR family transcriptional regulator/MocR family aminotransferase
MSRGADFLQLDPRSAPARGLTGWLADGLRAAIIDGRLDVGASLPPSRELADDLGVSRGVVVEAYQRLKDEGLVSARPGAGTRVLAYRQVSVQRPAAEPAKRLGVQAPGLLPRRWRETTALDLSPGVPDLSGFPRAAWLRAERHVLTHASVTDLGYPDLRGIGWLRTELAAWLTRTRGLQANPDEIIVVTGVAQALTLLAQQLRGRGVTEIAIEDPGSRGSRDLFAYWGLRPVPIRVDEDGLSTSELRDSGLRAALLTPAHQFPTGVLLAPERRRALLDWAADAGGLIIEDDYDAEFRYDRAPVPALHASAPDHVAYAGSTSKTLAPGMRLGWLIPPARMYAELLTAKHAADLGCPALPQMVLARLISTGELEQHIRQVRKRQRIRRDALLAAVHEHMPQARVRGIAAGLHLLITFPGLALPDTEIADRILDAGVLVHPLSWHCQRDEEPGIVLGYAAYTPDQLSDAVRRAASCLLFLALAAGERPQLQDAGGAGQADQNRAAQPSQQQRHAEREMTVRPKERDVHGMAVLQDEQQGEQQDYGETADCYP